MKKTKRCCALPAAFLSGLLIILLLTSALFVPKNNAKENGMIDYKANGILGEPEQSVDVLFLGDSECYCAFIPTYLLERYGITSYNCGTAVQNLYYTREFLKKAFEKQTPKVVVLETNAIFREFSFVATIVNKFDQWLPVFRYHDRWKQFGAKDLNFSGAVYTHREDAKGYRRHNKSAPASSGDYMADTDETKYVSFQNRTFVKDFRDYCEKRGAKLILVSTPSTVNWNMKRHNGIAILAENLELDYFDLNLKTSPVQIDWSKDTWDKGDHMNWSGACKVTDWLGSYLKSSGLA